MLWFLLLFNIFIIFIINSFVNSVLSNNFNVDFTHFFIFRCFRLRCLLTIIFHFFFECLILNNSLNIEFSSFLFRFRFSKMYKSYNHLFFSRIKAKLHNNKLYLCFKYGSNLSRNFFTNNNIFWFKNIFNFMIFLVVADKYCFFIKLLKSLFTKFLSLLFMHFIQTWFKSFSFPYNLVNNSII